jgi:hypothetical protein
VDDRELDELLGDGRSIGVGFANDDGDVVVVWFQRHELANPVAWRAALRRALGHEGYEPPRYSQEDHDTIVRVMFRAARMGGR